MKQQVIYAAIGAVVIGLLWLVAWGDFAEWHYTKNLHCEQLQNSRQEEICKSIETYQEYEFFGHAMISVGYRSSFVTARKAWCELSLTEKDLELLKEMQYPPIELPVQLQVGSGMLFSLLDAQLHPDSPQYVGSLYDPTSASYLLEGGCPVSHRP